MKVHSAPLATSFSWWLAPLPEPSFSQPASAGFARGFSHRGARPEGGKSGLKPADEGIFVVAEAHQLKLVANQTEPASVAHPRIARHLATAARGLKAK